MLTPGELIYGQSPIEVLTFHNFVTWCLVHSNLVSCPYWGLAFVLADWLEARRLVRDIFVIKLVHNRAFRSQNALRDQNRSLRIGVTRSLRDREPPRVASRSLCLRK